jgi:biotin synthase
MRVGMAWTAHSLVFDRPVSGASKTDYRIRFSFIAINASVFWGNTMCTSVQIPQVQSTSTLLPGQIQSLLQPIARDDIDALSREAQWETLLHCGRKVFFRGIIEFSNVCTCDCYYCGLRRSNRGVGRYQLAKGEILRQARWFADRGFGSVVLQSGQRRDPRFVGFLTDVVRSVKRETRSAMLPEGLGITLSVGEQSPDDYGRFFDAGAHRYLLNIETSSPRLFRRWHPENQAYDSRRRCLEYLRSIGFQVGTGVMIGAPWQTAADLAADVAFFKDMDVDMIGMVPYIPHPAAPLAAVAVDTAAVRQRRALLAIAAVRLVLQDVNIAVTTALQALAPMGREKGISFGANIIMHQAMASGCRKRHTLYNAKPRDDESNPDFQKALESRIRRLGRIVGRHEWGDPPHVFHRQALLRQSA